MKTSCIPFLFQHDWAQWEDIGESDKGTILIQERRCKICNKAQRRQTTWLGGNGINPLSVERVHET